MSKCNSNKNKHCKVRTCKKGGKRCRRRPKTIRRRKGNRKSINKRSYSPSVNRRFMSKKRYSEYASLWDNNKKPKIENLFYRCRDGDIRIEGKCLSYKDDEAKNIMLKILALEPKSYQRASNIMAPKQVMRNCWLNAFFVCYFISDKGQKFFKQFRHIMITGKSIDNNIFIDEKYREGLWYLNKLITGCLFGENYVSTKKFAREANTNKILKLLKGRNETVSEKNIISPNVSYNPIMFYIDLFKTLKIKEGVQYVTIRYKSTYNKLFESGNDYGSSIELFIIERLDEIRPEYLYVGDNPPPKSFIYQKRKYVLDAAVLRDVEKRHFTSYITLDDKDYAFDGAANRALRNFEWKKKLYSNKSNAWDFGSRKSDTNEVLEEKFDFSRGYHILFYYLE